MKPLPSATVHTIAEQPNRTRLRVSRAASLCGQPEAVHSKRYVLKENEFYAH